MDNFKIDIVAEGVESLKAAMSLAFAHNAPGGKAVAYKIIPEKGMVFLWSNSGHQAVSLPFKLDADGAADFANRWLEEQETRLMELEHDGDNGKGFRLYCEDWGHVNGDRYAICAVQPVWAWYGK